jgi:adenylate cyclase class 2
VIEAELTARVRDAERVRQALRALAAGVAEECVYHDTYYDRPDGTLARDDRELRLRVIDGQQRRRCLLTYKDTPADPASGSKPEWETEVADPAATDAILRGLGFEHDLAFDKHCATFAFQAHGRRLHATLARVPELDGCFLEVETLVGDHADLQPALDVLRQVLDELGVPRGDLTTEQYTDLVRERRAAAGRRP